MNAQPLPQSRDLFYETLIQFYVNAPHFEERSWLLEQVEQAMAAPDCRFLLLTAEPGAGKTAFTAWLANQHKDWLRYFIRRDSQTPLSGGDSRSFLFALGYQLATLYPAIFHPDKLEVVVKQSVGEISSGGSVVGVKVEDLYISPFYETALKIEQHAQVVAGELAGLSIKRFVTEERFLEVSNLQYLALLGPAQVLLKEDPTVRITVLVDALDELRYQPGQENILRWLANCPELPPNIRIIVTSRPDQLLETFKKRQRPWLKELAIDALSDDVWSDLRHYATNFTAQESIQQTFARKEIDTGEFVDNAITKAAGNFQYLSALYRGIEQALQENADERLHRLIDIQEMPADLGELYSFFLTLIKDSVDGEVVEARGDEAFQVIRQPKWDGLYQPILGVLTVAREPLTVAQIRAFCAAHIELRQVQEALGRLRQFLDVEQNQFRLYHTTFSEFLTSPETQVTYPFCYLDPAEWHRKIVASYRRTGPTWAQIDWGSIDTYGLLYLVTHLYALHDEAAYREELYNLICPSFMKEKQRRTASQSAFAEDVAVVIEVAGTERPPNILQEVRASLIFAALGSVSTSIPLGAIGALAYTGEAERALHYNTLVQDFEQRCRALLLIGQALLQSGKKENARHALLSALAATDDYVRSTLDDTLYFDNETNIATAASAFSLVATRLDEVGELEQLIRAVAALWFDWSGYLLARIADQLAAVGESAVAAKVGDYALAMIPMIRNPNRWYDAASLLAEVFALGGDIDQALALVTAMEYLEDKAKTLGNIVRFTSPVKAQEIATQWLANLLTEAKTADRSVVLVSMVEALLAVGNIEEALHYAKRIRDKWSSIRALSRMAQEMALAGQQKKSRQIVRKLLMQVLADSGPEWLGYMLAAEQGAGVLVEKFHEFSSEKGIDLQALAGAFVYLQDYQTLVEAALAVRDGELQLQAFFWIAQQLTQWNDEDGALRIAEIFAEMPGVKVHILSLIADALLQRDERPTEVIQRALAAANSIVDAESRIAALGEVTQMLIDSGDLAQALEIADSIPDTSFKKPYLGNIAYAYAVQGETKEANQLVERLLEATETIACKAWLVGAMKSVVQVLSRLQRTEEARQIVQSASTITTTIQDAEQQAMASVELVQALLSIDEFEQAVVVADSIGRQTLGEQVHATFHMMSELADDGVQARGPHLDRLIQALESCAYDVAGYRSLSFSDIAEALTYTKGHKNALEAANRAFEAAQLCRDEEQKIKALAIWAIVHTFAREPQEPAANLQSLLEFIYSQNAFSLSAMAATRSQITIHCKIAQMLAEANEKDSAVATVEDALKLLSTLGSLAFEGMRSIGTVRQVRQDMYRQSLDRTSTLIEIAETFALIGASQRAIDIAGEALKRTVGIDGTEELTLSDTGALHGDLAVASALSSIVDVLVLADAKDEAIEIVKKALKLAHRAQYYEEGYDVCDVLARIALALQQVGDEEQALAIWRTALEEARFNDYRRVLNAISDGAPVIAALDKGKTLLQVLQATLDLEHWWPMH